MSSRIGDYLVEGYFSNLKPKSTHGMLVLEGMDTPIHFDLTGDPGGALRGRSFNFRRAPGAARASAAKRLLAPMQIGVVGTMEVRMAKVPVGDLAEALAQGTKPDFEWRALLFLEWYSQNGRVVLELEDPLIVIDEGEPFPELEVPTEWETGGFSVTEVRFADDGTHVARVFAPMEEEAPCEPEDLTAYLDRLNRERESKMRGEDELELETGERIGAREEGVFIASLLAPRRLPSPASMDEEQAEALVRTLLMELALLNIAVHLCPHCTYCDAYRYMIEELVHNERVSPRIVGSGWTMNFNYGESCPACIAEIEAKYADMDPDSLGPNDGEDEPDRPTPGE